MRATHRWIVLLAIAGIVAAGLGLFAARSGGDPVAAVAVEPQVTPTAAVISPNPAPSRGASVRPATAAPTRTTSPVRPSPLVLDVTPDMLLTPDEFPDEWADAWRQLGTGAVDASTRPHPCARAASADPEPADGLMRRMFLDVPGATDGYDGPSGRQVVLASRSTSAAQDAVLAIRADLRRCPTDPPADSADSRFAIDFVRELPDLGDGGFIAQITEQEFSTHLHVGVVRVGNLVTIVTVDDYVGGDDASVPSPRHMLATLRVATARLSAA